MGSEGSDRLRTYICKFSAGEQCLSCEHGEDHLGSKYSWKGNLGTKLWSPQHGQPDSRGDDQPAGERKVVSSGGRDPEGSSIPRISEESGSKRRTSCTGSSEMKVENCLLA